MRGRL